MAKLWWLDTCGDEYGLDDLSYYWMTAGGTPSIASTSPRRSGSRYITGANANPSVPFYLARYVGTIDSQPIPNNAAWIGMGLKVSSSTTVDIGIGPQAGSGSANGGVRVRGSDGLVAIVKGATTYRELSGVVQANTWIYLEAFLQGSSPKLSILRINGQEQLRYEGLPVNDSMLYLSIASSGQIWVDDVYVLAQASASDAFGDTQVSCVLPAGNGNVTFSKYPTDKANWQCVQDSGGCDEDTTFVYRQTGAGKETYTPQTVSAQPGTSIAGIYPYVIARKQPEGSSHIFYILWELYGAQNMGTIPWGQTGSLSGNYKQCGEGWLYNPATNQPFTDALLNDLWFGLYRG